MSPAPLTATANQDSYGGVAGQNLVLLRHLQQPLAPVERVHCPGPEELRLHFAHPAHQHPHTV